MVDYDAGKCLLDGLCCGGKFVKRYSHIYVMRYVDENVVPNKVKNAWNSKDRCSFHLAAKLCPLFAGVPLDVFANVVDVDGEADD